MTLHNRTQTFLFSPPRRYQSGNSPRSAQSFRDSRSPRSSPSTLPAGDRPRTQRHPVQRPPPKTPPRHSKSPRSPLPARVPTPRAHCPPPEAPRPPPPEGPGTSRRKPRTRRWFRRFSRRPPPELRKAPAGTELPHLPAKAPSLSSTGSPADLRTTKSAPPPNGNTPRTQEGHKMKASRKQEGTTGPVSLAAPSLLAFICRLSA